MPAKIVINGQEYDSVEEMPPEARAAYEQLLAAFADADQNGMPDMVEEVLSNMPAMLGASLKAAALNVIHYNGQTYNNLDEMPPEARAAYEKAMSKLALFGDQDGDGQPDLMAAAGAPPPAAPEAPQWNAQPPAAPNRMQAPPPEAVLSGDQDASTPRLPYILIGGAVVLVLLLVAVAVGALFVSRLLPGL
jgi:hypothetical protein